MPAASIAARPRAEDRRWLPALLALGLLACGGYLATELALLGGRCGFPLDDSWIHLQFARSLAAGEGLAYNPGEPVSGSTAPLWTALLALLQPLPGNPVAWAKLAGAILYLAGGHASFRLARELGLGPGAAAFAAGLVLATSSLVWSALSGMEVPLFVWLSLWGILLHLRERRAPARLPLALPALAAASLARPEGLLLLVLAALDRLLCARRSQELELERPPLVRLGQGLLVAAVVLLPAAALYTWIGGSPLPTTFAAKAGGERNLLPSAHYLYMVSGILFRPQPIAFLLAGAGVLRLLDRLGTRRDAGLLLALWVLGLPLAYSCLTPQGRHLLVGNLGRYFFPLFPPMVLLAVLALEPVGERLGPWLRAGRFRLPLRAALSGILLVPTAWTLVQGAARYAQNVANVEDSDVRMALWLRDRLRPEAVVAVQDVGALKYFLPNRLVDLSGIVSPAAVESTRRAVSEGDPFGERGMAEFLRAERPDYVVAFPDWYPRLVAESGLRPILRLRIPDNITMAADELVFYATPWTRHALRRLPGDPASDRPQLEGRPE
jgi:hypothetical protein